MSLSPAAAGVADEYARRLQARGQALALWERRHAWVSYVRLALATAGAALLGTMGAAAAPWLVALVVIFVGVAYGHARLLNARDRARSAVAFYERGLRRVRYEWIGHGDAGDRFRPPDHLYADDLDLFGHGSLFELLATCRTEAGLSTLARWLLDPAAPDEVRLRQTAIRELAPHIDLREAMAVEADGVAGRVDGASLALWAVAPRHLPGRVIRTLVLALPATLAGVATWEMRGGPGGLVEAVLIAQVILGLTLRARVRSVIATVDSPSRGLELFAGLARVIEHQRFTSPRLTSVHHALASGDRPASTAIAALAQRVALLSSRGNMFFAPVAALLLWATQCAFAIERWRDRHGNHVPRWLEAVAEFESLTAIAAYAFEHPDRVFAEIEMAPTHVTAVGMAHPLLPPGAVANDLSLGGAHPVLVVVSGSNMSGKSTFLRALGLNVVLAQAGAPVRAASFRLSPLAVGASIRVLDSLQDGKSRFFAEILRLRQVVELGRERNGAVVFLLDELLAGTNSHDRREGSAGVLRGLVDLGAIGLATTHDLALAEIATALAPRAANRHFSDEFLDEALKFDYQLRDGPVRSSNALALMRSIGLDV